MLTLNKKHLEIFIISLFVIFIISSLDASFAVDLSDNNINSVNSVNRAYNTKYPTIIIKSP